MKRLWILVVLIFSAVILLGGRTSYTTSRIVIERPEGVKVRKNRVTIRYEESKNTYSFHKKAEYYVFLKNHRLIDFYQGRLEVFPNDGSDRISLSLYTDIDEFIVEKAYYRYLGSTRGRFFYERDTFCRTIGRGGHSCNEDEKAMTTELINRLLSTWSKRMKLDHNVYRIQVSPPPIAFVSKIDFLDFMPHAKRKSASSKVTVRRVGAGSNYDRVEIYYLKSVDGFYYQKMAVYSLCLKGHVYFDDHQGSIVLFSQDEQSIRFWIGRDGVTIMDKIRYRDIGDDTRASYGDKADIRQASELWKAWSERLELAKLVPELLASPPESEPRPPLDIEDYMP